MWLGVMYGLGACALWGIVYLMPLLLPSYDSLYIAIARAFVMGGCSIGIWLAMRPKFKVLTQNDWSYAIRLTLVGNLIQCWFLMMSVAYAGVAVAGICFGGVPVLVALISNERDRRAGKAFVHVKKLVVPLLSIMVGFVAINMTELEVFLKTQGATTSTFFFGLACGLISTAMWTWYPIRNADWLLSHPNVSPAIWTCAQSVVLFPIAGILYVIIWFFDPHMSPLLGETPWRFILLMLLAGTICAWFAATLWNACSAKLPTFGWATIGV